MNTTDRILSALKKCGITVWCITEKEEETAELFFVKKQLDTRRTKDTHKFHVTVYRDAQQDGNALRGFTETAILSSDSDDEIERRLNDAYFAAQFAMNPYFDLPDPVSAPTVRKTGVLASAPLAETAGKMAEALFAPDTRADAFLNSAEIFVSRVAVRILTSAGTDVSYTDGEINGEFVVQCKFPEDVEMHRQFAYDECAPEALKAMVAEALGYVADRAKAQKILKSGKYDVILSGGEVEVVLSYYTERANASLIYSHYSTWKAGDDVQSGEDCALAGEALDLTLCATVPYSVDGVPMRDRALLRGGKLSAVYGPSRFCRYLGIEPTGNYGKFRCENRGSLSLAEMKNNPCLHVVTFSDFQMDAFSGHFGGEIRLAYLCDGKSCIPVTGGSVNGSLLEAQTDLSFSTDRYLSSTYEGPYAMRLRNVSVAGCVD